MTCSELQAVVACLWIGGAVAGALTGYVGWLVLRRKGEDEVGLEKVMAETSVLTDRMGSGVGFP
jgi:hypothetical protein